MAKLKLKEGDWIVVADGSKALFLRNLTDHQDPHFEVVRVEEQENPPTHAQGADRPGRMPDAGPGQRSAVAQTDWHQLAEDRFAADLAQTIYKMVHKRAPKGRLIVVAAPRVLGELRDHWHPEVREHLIAEIPKTLTNHPVWEIEDLVREALEAA